MKRFADIRIINRLMLALLLGMLVITLSCETIVSEATITGKVINIQTLQPLSGVFVRAFGFAESALTDSVGDYELVISVDLTDVTEATLEFSKSGFVTDTLSNVGIEIGKTVTAPPRTLSPISNAVTSGTVLIKGNVVNALDANEVIEGAFVRVLDHENSGTLSDANGNYLLSFSILVGDSISVSVEVSKATFLSDKITNIAISFADTVMVRTANLIPISSAGGVVTLIGKVVNGVTAAPLEGALVRALKHPETALTDSSGSYTLSVTIEAGQLNVLTLSISKASFAPDSLSSIGVALGDTVNAPPASLIPLTISQGLGGIRGKVVNGITEAPIEGAFIRTLNHPEAALSDAQGNYSFAVTITGDESKVVNLEIIKEGFLASTLPNLALTIGDTIDVPPTNLLPIDPEGSRAIVRGVIVDDVFFDPVQGVQIRAIGHDETTLTNELGIFSLTLVIKVDESNIVDMVFSQEEFITDTLSNVTLTIDSTITIADQALTPLNRAGAPASATLVDITRTSISIQGVGGEEETSILTFLLRDKNSTALDRFHHEQVTFSLNGPGGGEFISPETTLTDDEGLVRTALNSGTIAGAVQIVVSFDPGTGIINSAPTPIVIHGGQPDSAHFSIRSSPLNIAGLVTLREATITAIVGDKFSNPVRPGTAVHFRSKYGIVDDGSEVTDEKGFASNILISSEPLPLTSDNGLVRVIGETRGENGKLIIDSTFVLFSGHTQLAMIGPSDGFAIADGGSQTFTIQADDIEWGNPLEGGSTIKITASGGALSVKQIIIPDTQTQGPGTTLFTFTLKDASPNEDPPVAPAQSQVTIEIASPNGNVDLSFGGTVD